MECDEEFRDSASSEDEELEDVEFLSNVEPRRSLPPSAVSSPIKPVAKQGNSEGWIKDRLENLLLKCKEEAEQDELHQEMKEKLSRSINQGSQEEGSYLLDVSLKGELADHIEDLDVKSDVKPDIKITVFHLERYCCLFQYIYPVPCDGSFKANNAIDNSLLSITPDDVIPLLLSECLPVFINQVSNSKNLFLWLLCLASSQPSPVPHLCHKHVGNILKNSNYCQLKMGKNDDSPLHLSPLEIICVFVNMGADLGHLLGDQLIYTEDNVRSCMNGFKQRRDESSAHKPLHKLDEGTFHNVLGIITQYLQTSPKYTVEELDLLFCVVMRISLDDFINSLCLSDTFHALLFSLLECYKQSDWPVVASNLCRQVKNIPHSHQSCVHLVELMPQSQRGNYLQMRLSLIWLRSCILTNFGEDVKDFNLETVSPLLITNLGHNRWDSVNASPLYCGLRQLLTDDANKMDSALTLLDLTVGDESNRRMHPKDEMTLLVDQLKLLIRDIRDSIKMLELSKLKDKMTVMSVKWMSTSAQHTKTVQKSLFPWVSSSQVLMAEEKLKDGASTETEGKSTEAMSES